MADASTTPSARETELLEAAYRYVLEHGLADLSLRPLATAIGSSPRVLMFLFGNKEGLVRALLARARADELAFLGELADHPAPPDLAAAVDQLWRWLSAPDHQPLLRLWTEAYARSLVDPQGPWSGFARTTVDEWLTLLATFQPPGERDTPDDTAARSLALAVLRGALLDLLATGDEPRTTAAVRHHVRSLRN
ncbi:TetR/AcrR family transcriptional regulator [Nocardia fluminea]|uniref:TetR family transcriptional regulator n=1 Tax=Nocardia fluminea TaxID=134984 RepID=A0A2N3VJM9_9NOCA|nr:TetR/AcrR family transcriptional regulator [Nocardia fluminea]PKV81821.1 TetR family transcriptional regulator [Nocardia fluminea]